MTRLNTKSKLILAAAVVVTVGAAIAGLGYAGDERPRQVAPPAADDVAAVRAAALDIAARNGDANPSRIRIVAGPRLAVVARLMGGAEVDTDQDVYVVALEGTFAAHEARVPPGAPTPRGTHLILVFDTETKTLLDLNLSHNPPALEQFGTPIGA